VDTCQCLPGEDVSSLDTELGSFTGQRRNGKWGLVNKAGKLILDHVYDDINYHDNSALIGIVRNGKYGMADTTGKIVIPLAFGDWFEPVCGGELFESEKNGKDVIYDKTGKQILAQYSRFQEMVMEDGSRMLAIIQGKLYGFYDPATGKIITPKYTSLSYYGDPHYLNIGVGDKFGYIDKAGNTVVPPLYDYVDLHAIPKNDQLAKINLKDKTGLFDIKQQKVLLPVVYDYISTFDDSTVLLVTKNGLSGVCDFSGKMLAPVKYKDIVPFDSVYSLLVSKDSGKAEILNKRTHELYKLPFDTAFVAYEGRLMLVWQQGKSFLYDIDKKQKVEGDYSKGGFPEYMGYFSNHRAIVVRNQKFGYIDGKGNYVVQPKYDYISNFHKGVAAVYECLDTAARIYRYGYIDSTGKEIVPIIYDVPQELIARFTEEAFFGDDDAETLVLMKNDGKKGLAGLNGRIIVPAIFDKISPEKHSRGYLVTLGDKFGVLDMNGREIIKPQYEKMMLDEIEGYDGRVSFNFPVMMQEQDKDWTYIDERGKSIGVSVGEYADFSTLDWGGIPVVDPPLLPAPPVSDEK